MRREQLEHAIRTACQIIEHPEVIVVGSQAILGTYDESQLPAGPCQECEGDLGASGAEQVASDRASALAEVAGKVAAAHVDEHFAELDPSVANCVDVLDSRAAEGFCRPW